MIIIQRPDCFELKVVDGHVVGEPQYMVDACEMYRELNFWPSPQYANYDRTVAEKIVAKFGGKIVHDDTGGKASPVKSDNERLY